MNTTTKAVEQRRAKATEAALRKMHYYWHTFRKLPVCEKLACEHPWAP